MKKIFAACFVVLSMAACEKNDTDLHCWECTYEKMVDDVNGQVTTTEESREVCGLTEEEIRIYEQRYQRRTELNTTYGDMKCTQIPRPSQK